MRTPLLCLILVIASGACGGSRRTNPDAETDRDADPDAVATGDDASTDGPDIPGEQCGGFVPRTCAAGEFCDYPENTCGDGDAVGTCRKRPVACPAIIGRPVCACDGQVHPSDCIAYRDGFDLNARGCTVPAGSFECGYAVCTLATQYCHHQVQLPADTFECLPLPAACPAGAPTCECLRGEQCAAGCTGDSRTGLTLTCQ